MVDTLEEPSGSARAVAAEAGPRRPRARTMSVVALVVVLALVVVVGVRMRDGSGGDLSAFDPDELDWVTYQDPLGRFVVDLPGHAELRPAQDGDVETAIVHGPANTAVAAREIGPGQTVFGLDRLTAGLGEQLRQLFDIEQVTVLDGREEPFLDGKAMGAEFEGVIDGAPVVGIVDVRTQLGLVSVVSTVGIREERADVQRVHERVIGGFRATV